MRHFLAVLLGVWFGGQLFAGYVAAPVLFKFLPSAEAGFIAGKFFYVQALFGAAVWLIVALARLVRHQSRNRKWVMGAIWLQFILMLLNFGFSLTIEAMKNDQYQYRAFFSTVNQSFASWHAASAVTYLISCLLGFFLLLRLISFRHE